MRRAARVALAIVVLLGGFSFLPRVVASVDMAVAAVPTPLISDILGTPRPDDDDPLDNDDDDKDDKDDD